MGLGFPVQSEETIEQLGGESICLTARSVTESARDSQSAWEESSEAWEAAGLKVARED